MGDGIFGTDYVSFADMFDGGGPGASGDTYSNVSNVDKDKNNDGHISFTESDGNLAGGIDGSTDNGFFQNVFSPNADNKDPNLNYNDEGVNAPTGGIGALFDSIGQSTGLSGLYGGEPAGPDYYARTLNTIGRTRGSNAAQTYFNQMIGKNENTFGGLQFQDLLTADTTEADNNLISSNDGSGGSLPIGDGDGDGDGDEEEIEYTQMPPFFGGYQPATRESTLVDARGIGSFKPNPRLDPIYPQRPPLDEVIPFDFGAPANLGDTHYDPALQTTYTYQEKPDGQGGFYSGWDITEGTGGTVGLYGNSQPQGVASLFGNEQAPRSMYQGIMA